jgi:sugar/nucleoside kinase (ribokinase family)
MKKIAVVLGDVNIDIITPPFDPQILQDAETSCVLDEFTMSLGGNAINMAGALAALKDNHQFIGGLGDCAISEWIKKKCKSLEINTKFGILEGKSAGITFALTYTGGKRQFVATLGTNNIISLDDLDLSILDNPDMNIHLHRAGFWYTSNMRDATANLFKKVIEKGDETSLDVGWDPDDFSEKSRDILYKTLNYTKYFFANEKEILAITNKSAIDDAYDELLTISKVIENPVIVVHRGEKGSAIISRNERIFIDPVPNIEVINPTGSGDVFNGGFVHGLLEGLSLKDSAIFAGKLAAVHLKDITKIYPTLQDVENL